MLNWKNRITTLLALWLVHAQVTRAEFLPYSDPKTKNSATIDTPAAVKVDGRMGSTSYAVPFVAPPGTGGLTPQLSLGYSSVSEAGPYGWGWQLSGMSVIERSTRRGQPAFNDLAGCGTKDTVEIDGELLVADPTDCKRFHRIQSDFSRILYDSASDSWTVTSTDGTRMMYGALDSGASPSQSRLHSPAGKTFRWALDQVVDARGNAYRISYFRATGTFGGVQSETQLYPQRVHYNYHVATTCHATPTALPGAGRRMLQLEWEERFNTGVNDPADRPTNYRPGFRIETAYRLKRVLTGIDDNGDGRLVSGNGGDLISAQYDMVYAPKSKLVGGTPYIEPTSKLVEIKRSGAAGEAFPSTTRFEYSEPARQFLDRQKFSYQSGASGAPFFPTVDSERALPGAPGCELQPPGTACYSCVFDFARCNDFDRSGCCTQAQNELYRSSNRLIDMNGDGVLDRVRIRKTALEWEMCPGLPGGQGYGPCVPWTFDGSVKAKDGLDFTTDTVGVIINDSIRAQFDNANPAAGTPRTQFGVHADLVDLDGDGLPDRVEDHYYCDIPGDPCPYGAPTSTDPNPEYRYWSFHRNTGTGFARKKPWLAPLYRSAYGIPLVRSIALYEVVDVLQKTRARSRLVDVNGDGRPDHVVVDKDGKLHVSFNLGTRFASDQIIAQIDLPTTEPSLSTTNGQYQVDREFLDLNGDGLPDQLLSGGSLDSGGPPVGAMEIRFNTGVGFQYNGGTGQLAPDPARLRFTAFGDKLQQTRKRAVIPSPTPSEVTAVSESFADFNGDDVLDRVVTSNTDDTQGVTSGTIDIYYGLGDGTFMPQAERWPMPAFRKVNGMSEFVEKVPGTVLYEMMDVNGDGFMDRIGNDPESTYAQLAVYLHPGPRALLTKVTNEDGGVTELKYKPTTGFAQRPVPLLLFATTLGPEPGLEQDQTVDLRQAMWVLTERKTSDGRATTTLESWSYAQPRYDWGRRETVGMRASEMLDEKGLLMRSVYFQSRALRGRTWYEEQASSGGELLRMAINDWTAASPLTGPASCFDGSALSSCVPVPGSTFPELTHEETFDFDSRTAGAGTSQLRARVKTREFDERFGRVDTETDYGAVGPDNAENTADDPTKDDLKTAIGYADNPSAWLVNVPITTLTYSGGVLSGYDIVTVDGSYTLPVCGLVTASGKYTGTEWVVDSQSYDEFGNVSEVRDGNNDPAKPPTVKVTYDDRFKTFVVASTNALGHTMRFQTEPRWGDLVKVLGPNGDLDCRQFDGFGRLTGVSRYEARLDPTAYGNPGTNSIPVSCDTDLQRIDYVSVGNPAGQYVATTSFTGTDQYQSRQYFDGLGRVYRDAKPANACSAAGSCTDFFVTAKTFDKLGREVCQSLPTRGDATTVGACEDLRHRTIDYDIFDRPTRTQLSVTGETESTISYAVLDLDGDGTREAVTTTTLLTGTGANAAPARVTRTGVDIRDQVVAIEETVGTNAKALTRVVRDAEEQIIKVDGPDIGTHPNQLLFSYDLIGRQTQMAKPKIADDTSSGPVWGQVYDKASNLMRKTSPRGANLDVVYVYDSIERKIGEDVAPFCAPGAAWSSCMGPEDTNAAYDSFLGNVQPGRLLAVGSPGPTGAIADIFNYNHRGEKISSARYHTGNTDVPAVLFSFAYDRQSRPVSETFPDGEIVSWQYNGALLGSVKRQLSAGAASETLIDQLSYHRSGALESYRLPQPNVSVKRRYVEKDDRIERIDVTRGASEVLLGLGFSHDLAGNLKTVDAAASGSVAGGTQTFNYDPLHRLTRAADARPSGYGTGDSAYNPLGTANLTTLGTRTLTYGQNNFDPNAVTQLVDTGSSANNRTFNHDVDGNLTERVLLSTARDTFSWNSYGRLTRYRGADGTVADYTYDSAGERLLKRVTAANGQILANRLKPRPDYEIDLVARTRTKHIMFAGERVMSIESNGIQQGAERSRVHFHRDQLGHPVVLSDRTGTVVQRNVFTPFGAVTIRDGSGAARSTAQSLSPYLFDDYELDTESGLYYAHARYYDGALGRFISYDPMLAKRASGGSQQLDPYSYADNRPTVFVDQSGTEPSNSCSAWRELMYSPGSREDNLRRANAGEIPSMVPREWVMWSPRMEKLFEDVRAAGEAARAGYNLYLIANELLGAVGGAYLMAYEANQGVDPRPQFGLTLEPKVAPLPLPTNVYRGAFPWETVNFEPKPNEFQKDPKTGLVKDSHGVSIHDNPFSALMKGRLPHEVDQATIPGTLRIKQRGEDPKHFEITPKPGAKLTPDQYRDACSGIGCLHFRGSL